MKKTTKGKIGTIFLVSILALAGVGISYAGFTDFVTVYGTVDTATVSLDIEAYSGTDIYKVWDGTDSVPEEMYIFRGFDFERPTLANVEAKYPDAQVEFISSAWAMPCTSGLSNEVDMQFNNLFPCKDFKADFIVHYEGSIPAKVNFANFLTYSDWLLPLWESGAAYVTAYRCTVPNPDAPIGPNNYPVRTGVVVDIGTQLHFCDYVWVEVTIHLPQDNDLQDLSGSFTGRIDVIQWNEYIDDGGCEGEPCDLSKTYTLDADFDEGILINVNHDSPNNDQLQLNEGEQVILPFLWVPNEVQGTVSKVDTLTGKELGRYYVAPPSLPGVSTCSPSRTTVDIYGNCWVGIRQAGTVVKIGLFEAGVYDDRNADGICQTSRDLDADGDITGAELLPWGEDECVLFEVLLRPGFLGTFVPGTIPLSSYDTNYWGTSPRGLAVDANNNLWAGTYLPCNYYYIDGSNGNIIRSVDLTISGHNAYGAVIDGDGILWSAGANDNRHLLRLDPSTDIYSIIPMGHHVYGLGLDFIGHLFVSGWDWNKLSRVDITTGLWEWTNPGPSEGRGVAVTSSDNNVWVVSTIGDKVYRYDNDGILLTPTGIPCGNGPTGVAVDAAGKVWVCNLFDDTIQRIDPSTNAVDLIKPIIGSGGHYSYSDMTGIISQTITTRIGTWEVVYDAGVTADFSMVAWTDFEPAGTSITVEVASSTDGATWSSWEAATNGGALTVPNGQYLKVKVTFQITSGDVSPILYDLTIHASC